MRRSDIAHNLPRGFRAIDELARTRRAHPSGRPRLAGVIRVASALVRRAARLHAALDPLAAPRPGLRRSPPVSTGLHLWAA